MGNIPKLLSPLEDLHFRKDIIGRLLESIGGDEELKVLFEQFLGNVTANADHKKLAYHLFCSVTVYISKHTTLDEQQDSALCGLIRQLHQEWIDDDAPPKYSKTPSHIETLYYDDVCPGQSASSGAAGPSGINTVADAKAAAVDASDVARGDIVDTLKISEMCEAFERTDIARSTTPHGFVREAEKYIPASPNFHRDVSPKDTVDLKARYPFGHRLMAKHGYDDQNGLGIDGSGIQRPIDASKLAHDVRGRDAPLGLGYEPKGKGKAPVNGCSTFETGKPTTGSTGLAVAWRKYVANPHAGDTTAKEVYALRGAKNSALQTIPTNGMNAAQHGSTTKTIVHEECIINDTWKDTTKSSGHTQNQEVKSQQSKVASTARGLVRDIAKGATVFAAATPRLGGKSNFQGRKNWARASDARKEVPQVGTNEVPPAPRGWVWENGTLKPDLNPRRPGNRESHFFG
ncbi:hypothetical protein HD806DRAFT_275579 [Xylariaceae sp. AK1471]|nr:hypothetical protein HD806DRAFT_275579 [Xylariaceae sp. AK1471]